MNEIHENLPAIHLPFFTIFDWMISGVILLGILFLLWKFFSVPQKKKVSPKALVKKFIPPVFNRKTALKELKLLVENKDWKSFSLRSTEILKKICEQQFQKPFAFATGKELAEILEEKISAKKAQQIRQFFLLTDPIKFAKADGKNEMAEEVIETLESFS